MPQLYSGARCQVLINGEVVAAAFVADWSIDTSATQIECIDSVFPYEIAPDRVRVSMNLRVYRSPDNDPVLDGYAPGTNSIGQSEQEGFTQAKYISLEIKDNNNKTIIYLPRAWIVRRSSSMAHGEFLIENWSIVSIGFIGPS